MTFQVGALCWAPDKVKDRAYIAAKVESVAPGGKVTCLDIETDGDQKLECKMDELLARSEDEPVVTEMDDLRELHVASVLQNVKQLYIESPSEMPGEGARTSIYSAVGPVLIAMNPFTNLPIYSDAWIASYRRGGFGGKRLPPHCYRTAEDCFQGLSRVPYQAVVICGESGAGKTVTNKKMIEYLCQASGDAAPPMASKSMRKSIFPSRNSAAGGGHPAMPMGTMRGTVRGRLPTPTLGGSKLMVPQPSPTGSKRGLKSGASMVDTIVGANDFLESFGNAKTTRNPNSSRFGKFTRFHYNADLHISGFDVDHYLLERSRIAGAPTGERNYHIFYELLHSRDAAKYKLSAGPESFAYTKQGSELTGFEDADNYTKLKVSMNKTGAFTDTYVDEVMSSIAALLHLGNVAFKGGQDSSSVDASSNEALKQACELLGLDAAAAAKAMTTKMIKAPGGAPIVSGIGVGDAAAQRDAVSKAVYSAIFDDLVGGIASAGGAAKLNEEDTKRIGLLDIFGFEDMALNGFEQMFINLANERIQHLFNSIMFDRELKIYTEEGIDVPFENKQDNLGCVQMFTGKPNGIVKKLTDQCVGARPLDGQKFVDYLNRQLASNKYYEVSTFKNCRDLQIKKGVEKNKTKDIKYEECFIVNHYAGEVLYTVRDFVPKSRDSLEPHLNEVMKNSTKSFVKRLFDKEDMGKSTVGEKFVAQLETLARTLEQGDTTFVRCIKANPTMRPGVVSRKLVLEQLNNGGVVSALQIRQNGLPDRLDYKVFLRDFGILEYGERKDFRDPKNSCMSILKRFTCGSTEGQDYACGHTKVFMHPKVTGLLRTCVHVKTKHYALKIQVAWRHKKRFRVIQQIDRLQEDLLSTQDMAEDLGISEMPAVKAGLEKAEQGLKPVLEAMHAAVGPDGLSFDDDAQVAKVQAAVTPFVKDIEALRKAVNTVMQDVNRIRKRKDDYKNVVSRAVSAANERAETMRSTLDGVEAECTPFLDMLDAKERADYEAAFKAAREKLNGFQKDLDRIREAALAKPCVDLCGTGDIKVADPIPEGTKLVSSIKASVDKVEELGFGVCRVRREFAQAVAELDQSYNSASADLAQLNDVSEEMIAEGMDVEPINAAWKKQNEADDLKEASRDAAGFRQAVGAFVEAVAEAKKCVEAGMEQVKQRRLEAQRRQEIHEALDRLEEQVTSAVKQARTAVQHGGIPDSLQALFNAAQGESGILVTIQEVHLQSDKPLEVFEASLDEVQSRASEVIGKLDGAAQEAMAARKEGFNKLRHVFGEGVKTKAASSRPHAGSAAAAASGPLSAEDFIKSKGTEMEEHQQTLMRIHNDLGHLQKAGVPRSSVSACTSHFISLHYGAVGKKRFEPGLR